MSILRSKFSGWTWQMERHFNGPGGSWNPVNIISDAVSSVGDALADIDPGPEIGNALAEVDTFVNREIPAGWVLPAAVAVYVASGYVDPTLFAAEGTAAGTFTGATETGLATLAGEGAAADALGATLLAGGAGEGAAFGMSDALAAELGLSGGSGLSTAGAAGGVLATIPTAAEGGFVGLSPEYASELGLSGGSGLSGEGASGNVLQGITGAESTGVKDALSTANRVRSLANMLTSGQTGGQQMNMPNMQTPQFEQFGGLYRGNQNPFLMDRTPVTTALPQTQNFLAELAEQGKTNDLATLLRNI